MPDHDTTIGIIIALLLTALGGLYKVLRRRQPQKPAPLPLPVAIAKVDETAAQKEATRMNGLTSEVKKNTAEGTGVDALSDEWHKLRNGGRK